jgi:uncharacterized membrane protein YfcA
MNWNLIGIIPLAFVCEFLDSSLGMGYGTTLTPLLIILGFEPLQIVPAVLLSEFVSGSLAAFLHHKHNNVNFNHDSQDTKIALLLVVFSVIGTIIAVIIAVNIPKDILKLLISIIVLSMGIIIIITLNFKPKFSWFKITFLGTIASVNKGLSGGGYGPLVMGGQMLSGIGVKNAIGITSLAEGITCLAGVILYFILPTQINWNLSPFLVTGAVLSVPFSVYVVKKIPERQVKIYVSIFIITIGIYSLLKLILRF